MMWRRIVTALVLVCTVVFLLSMRMPSRLTPDKCSELYRRYSHEEGVEAAFLQGFRLNDSVAVDVTTLSAVDSIAWNRLCADLGIYPIEVTEEDRKHVERGQDVIIICPSSIYFQEKAELVSPFFVSLLYHRISFYSTKTEGELRLIIRYYLETITPKSEVA